MTRADDWTIERHLDGQPEFAIALFDRFIALVSTFAPFTYAVSKSSITLKGSRRGFAGARPLAGGLRGYLDLQRAVTDRRIRSVSPYTQRLFVQQFQIAEAADLDEEFTGWLGEAYAVGEGMHLHGRAAGREHPPVNTVPTDVPFA